MDHLPRHGRDPRYIINTTFSVIQGCSNQGGVTSYQYSIVIAKTILICDSPKTLLIHPRTIY